MIRFHFLAALGRSVIRRLGIWWYRLDLSWLWTHKANLAFATAMSMVIGLIALMAYFAFAENRRFTAERQRMSDLGCLAQNIYHEARGEPLHGQQAVAEVTLNRVESTSFPDTVCEVVFEQRWDRKRGRYVSAFSWTELDHVSKPAGDSWNQALDIAGYVYENEYDPEVGDALFYHATSIEPYWANSKIQVTKIGSHIFYR